MSTAKLHHNGHRIGIENVICAGIHNMRNSRMKHRLRSPHHREMILPFLRLKLLLLQLDDMGHSRTLIDLLKQLLHCRFIALYFAFDL